jgi:hypothetical protein
MCITRDYRGILWVEKDTGSLSRHRQYFVRGSKTVPPKHK